MEDLQCIRLAKNITLKSAPTFLLPLLQIKARKAIFFAATNYHSFSETLNI